MNDKKITQTIFTVDNQKTTVDGFYKKAFIKNCQYYIYIFLISLCFSFKPVDTVSQENFNPCSTSNIALKHGEEITHEVFYNWNFVIIFRLRRHSCTRITNNSIYFDSCMGFFKMFNKIYILDRKSQIIWSNGIKLAAIQRSI